LAQPILPNSEDILTTTDLDLFYAATEHRRPERLLYYAGFTPDLDRRVREHIRGDDIVEHYGFLRRIYLPIRRPEGLQPLDYRPYWDKDTLPEGTTINGWGVAQAPSGLYHFWGYISPLRNAASIAEIENYPLDDLTGWDFAYMAELTREAHAAGKIVVGPINHMYETAWQIRGYTQFLTDMIEQPEWAQCLLDRLWKQNMAKAIAFTRAGADWIYCGDDVANQKAMMFAPATWRRMMLSRWAAVWAEVKRINPRAKIWYHSDGNIMAIVDDLVAAGVDILNPLQPECLDIDAIYQRHGHHLTLDGTIGTQSTMPWGSPADVKARVKEVIAKYGQNGGLIISPTHVLEPEVSIANIEALVEACREYK
jgi:uroporphyrinogen decarboxylase